MRLWTFDRDERGSVAILFGLSAVVLTAMSGAAIDYGRWRHVHSQTQQALDQAVLAAGRSLQLNGDFAVAESVATAYFNERVVHRLAVVNPVVSFVPADANSAVVGTATATVETPLLGLATVSSLPIDVTAKAAFQLGGGGGGSALEIALMLDVTGSMCDDGVGPCTSSTKLTALKTAANNLLNIVLKDNGAQSARVALVPFSTRVRVGPTGTQQTANKMKALTNLDRYWTGYYELCTDGSGDGGSESNGNWVCNASEVQQVIDWEIMPCVTDRTGVAQFTDAAPGADTWLNAHDGGRFPLSWDSANGSIAAGSNGSGTDAAHPGWHWNYTYSNWLYCADVAESNAIVPLSDNKSTLSAKINGLEAFGATAGALGTAWSWYVLSPNWTSIWNGTETPGTYDDLTTMLNGAPKLRKIAVMMTDGVYNTHRGWKEQDPDMVSANAQQLCTNMKAEGIEIFTVGFDLDSLPTADRDRAIATLQSCGTDVEHFYNTLNAAELQQAFNAIALQLSQLYLSR